MLEAANRAALASVTLAAYFENKYQLNKTHATTLAACYIEPIPTQIETNPNVEEGLLEIVNEMKDEK
jgi:hypothetical protein